MQTESISLWRRKLPWLIVGVVLVGAGAGVLCWQQFGRNEDATAPSAPPVTSGPVGESETAMAFASAVSEAVVSEPTSVERTLSSWAGTASPVSGQLDAPQEKQKTLELLKRPMGDMSVVDGVMRLVEAGDGAKAMLTIDEYIAKEPKRALWHFTKGLVASRSMQLYTAEESFAKAEMYMTENSSETRFIEGWIQYWRAANGLKRKDNSEAVESLRHLAKSKYGSAEAAKDLLAQVERGSRVKR